MLGVFLAFASPAEAQSPSARRFEITSVSDSTFTFPVGQFDWVKPRLRGMAVDPRRRDVLVARFEVINVRNGTATALITGETTRLTTDHVAQLNEPPRSRWKNVGMWVGLGVGIAAGVAIGSAL